VVHLGTRLFGGPEENAAGDEPYLIAVEAGGTLLLAALVGAAVIVSREKVRRPRLRMPKDEERTKGPE
jgi:hypothetical protein